MIRRLACLVVLARTPEGEVVELLPKQGLKRALDDAGRIKRRERAPAEHLTKEAKAEREVEEKKAAIAHAARRIALALLVSAAEEKEPDVRFWRLLATILSDGAEELPARRGYEEDWRVKVLPKMAVGALRGVVLELAIEQFRHSEAFDLAVDLYRIDMKEAKAQAKAEAKAAEKAAKADPEDVCALSAFRRLAKEEGFKVRNVNTAGYSGMMARCELCDGAVRFGLTEHGDVPARLLGELKEHVHGGKP